MKTKPDELTQEQALRAYASMMHNLTADAIEPLLAEDFHYASQWVFEEITSKREYLEYIRGKLQTIKRTGARVWVEPAENSAFPAGPCLVIAQDTRTNAVAIVVAEVGNGLIRRFDMCQLPPEGCLKRLKD